MSAYDPSAWTNLFVAAAGAAGALTGLVFVAASINIKAILESPGLPERTLAAVLVLLGVAVVSLVGLAPGQSRAVLGAELLGEGLAISLAAGLLLRTSLALRPPGEASHALSFALTTMPGTLPFLAGGASLIAGGGGGLYWTLGGIIGAIVGGVVNAWVFLVEILR